MSRIAVIVPMLFAAALCASATAEPLSVACPAGRLVACDDLDNPEFAGQPVVTGGCGGTSISHRDSILAVDSVLMRIWTINDTCGESQVCFQPLTVAAAVPRVAVLPFENLAASEDGARVMLRLMEDAVAQSPQVQLVPAGQVDDALLRARIRQPVLMDDEQRTRLAEVLGAQYFVIGSLLNYQVYADPYSGPIPMISCAMQLQRATDGRALWSESVHAVGNDGEWLFGMGVEHDITRLGRSLARRAFEVAGPFAVPVRCVEPAR